MKGRAYCSKCQNIVKYTINDNVVITEYIKGNKYSYMGKEALCSVCGEEVFAFEVNDYNLDRLDEVYKDKNML